MFSIYLEYQAKNTVLNPSNSKATPEFNYRISSAYFPSRGVLGTKFGGGIRFVQPW
jgi:hypothetical protein